MRAFRLAVLGLLAWAVAAAAFRPPLAVALLLLGPLVATPLALGLAHPGGPRAALAGRWRVALALQLPAAVAVAISFAVPVGNLAAALTLPWLLFAALLALLALLRFLEHGGRPLPELAVDAGLAYLLVGAFWLTASRWGQPFLGFGEPIEFLTAAHFHFAGLALPILGGLAGRALPGRWANATAFGLVAGMPLVATGITLQAQGIEWVNAAAVAWLVLATWGLIVLQARLALRAGPLLPRLLWGLSACALPVGMALAGLYASGRIGGPVQLTVDQMVATHAVVNVAGFALPGLLAWTLAGTPKAAPGLQILLPALGDRLDLAEWQERPFSPDAATPRPGDHEDRHEDIVGREPPGPPVPDGPFRRVERAIRAYRIFPAKTLRLRLARSPVEVDDAVGAEHPIAPGVRIALASRVTQVEDGPAGDGWRSGFTYRTLAGHPECGQESFTVEKAADGTVRVILAAWSRPGHPVARLLRGWARRRQLAAAKAALQELTAAAKA